MNDIVSLVSIGFFGFAVGFFLPVVFWGSKMSAMTDIKKLQANHVKYMKDRYG